MIKKNTFYKKNLSSLCSQKDFLDWFKNSETKKVLTGLGYAFFYDVLFFLCQIIQSNYGGITKSNFVKYFFENKNAQYLPSILCLSQIYKQSNKYPFLSVFEPVFLHTDVFEDETCENVSSLESFLLKVKDLFRENLVSSINSPFEDNKAITKKLSKREKTQILFFYLIDNVSKNISSALASSGLTEAASLVNSNRMFLVDGSALKQSGLTYPDRDRSSLVLAAQNLAKTILKRLEVEDNEYNYNLLVSYAMKHNYLMSEKEYNAYFYKLMLNKAKGEFNEFNRSKFNSSNWIHPGVVEFLALTLTIIFSQVKF